MPDPLTMAVGKLWRLHSELVPDTTCTGGYRAVEHDGMVTVMECDGCRSRVTTRSRRPGRFQHERSRRPREDRDGEFGGRDTIEREAGF